MKGVKFTSVFLIIPIIFCACSKTNQFSTAPDEEITVSKSADDIVNVTEMFTERDINFDYSDRDIYNVFLKDNASKSDSDSVSFDKNVVTITDNGVYILTGSLSDGQVIVNADDTDKIQIVLDGVNINCDTSAAIYCRSAKKLFVTTINDSVLSNTKDFENDDKKINGVIYSKSDLTLNGSKKLTINAAYGNCVVSNDDLAITSGEYDLTSAKHTVKANDSVRIANASLNLNAEKDAVHCENDDVAQGFVYIESGSLVINAQDDGIQASSAVKICGGDIDIQNSKEGITGRFIDVAGGSISITANDDGINASDKSQQSNNDTSQKKQTNDARFSAPDSNMQAPPERMDGDMKNPSSDLPSKHDDEMREPPADMPDGGFGGMDVGSTDCSLLISGGSIIVNAGGDGLDSNGIIKITGGETIIYGAENNGDSAFDYQTQATITGGSIIAIGMSGMAESFSGSSTQCSILYNLDSNGCANDKIELIKGSKSLISATAVKSYNSVLISCPEISKGKYTLTAGNEKAKIRVKDIICSNAKNRDFEKKNGKPDSTK